MFVPPFCPYPPCAAHQQPLPRFFLRKGSYHPRCRNHPVPRFRCRACGRSFSRQNFRADYRQKKPHLNAAFLHLMVSCVGLRQASRCLRVARRTVEHRFRWLAEHAVRYHRHRLQGATLPGPFQFDESESFESNRYQPVPVPVLIHRETFFLVAAAVGPRRRKDRMTRHQRRKRTEHEALHGRRPSRSDAAVRQVLQTLGPLTRPSSSVVLDSDHKPLYGRLGGLGTGGPLRGGGMRTLIRPTVVGHFHTRKRGSVARRCPDSDPWSVRLAVRWGSCPCLP